MTHHQIVSREDWIAARAAFLAEEKAFTRAKDALAEKRRALPWTEVKNYVFEGPEGPVTLKELFGTKSQLFIKHFMFKPEWTEGCIGCSFESDHIQAALPHLSQKDVAFAMVARAPLAVTEPFRKRMGWDFTWVSSANNDFNYDFHVSATPEEIERGTFTYNYETVPVEEDELSGVSVFVKGDDGRIFHTYSSYGRGFEEVLSTYAMLDIMPKGREEGPGEGLSTWVKHHDRYGEAPSAKAGCCAA